MSVENPARVKSLIGVRSGKLIVVAYSHKKGEDHFWVCSCDCGNTSVVRRSHLSNGHTKSCGCSSSRATMGARSLKHGATRTPEYNVWARMKQRCFDPNYKEFHLYGGRGITVCERWKDSSSNFLEDMGKVPKGMEIDRTDNNGNYSPDNCRWVTAKVNCRNRRTTRFLTHNGETMSVMDWSDRVGISGNIIRQRLDRQGWSVEKALNTPVDLPHALHFLHIKGKRRS